MRDLAWPVPLRAGQRRTVAAGEDWDLVFRTPTGRSIDSRSEWADWTDLLNEVGAQEARVHDARHARHTTATLLLDQGICIRVVQQILGHFQVSQTERDTDVTTQLGQDAAGAHGQRPVGPADQLQPEPHRAVISPVRPAAPQPARGRSESCSMSAAHTRAQQVIDSQSVLPNAS
ncbi:MAG TPA: tyrosine-type recombinase/integrase [Streptosporangiaceae bacterium]|nr:tyrosine-type recombinase/integrase [Streptosporangiaceae bacterium]